MHRSSLFFVIQQIDKTTNGIHIELDHVGVDAKQNQSQQAYQPRIQFHQGVVALLLCCRIRAPIASVMTTACEYIASLYREDADVQSGKHNKKYPSEPLISFDFFLGQELLILKLDLLSLSEIVAASIDFAYLLEKNEVPEVFHLENYIVKHSNKHEISQIIA